MQKLGTKIFLIIYIFLTIFQILTTNIREAYTYTPHQIDLQIQRMNSYPFQLAKLGYVLEVKKEIQIFERLISNFYFATDFKVYFPDRLPYILFPFFLIGLYMFAKERNKRIIMFYGFLASIATLTLLGPHAKYGPIIIVPYLIYFIVLGVLTVIKSRWL